MDAVTKLGCCSEFTRVGIFVRCGLSAQFRRVTHLFYWGLSILLFLPVAEADVALMENFDSLESWEPLTFDEIPRHSEYTIKTASDGTKYLKMQSEDAGSGLVLKQKFDVRKHSIIEWRWRVEEGMTGVNHRSKTGDDYPIRIYLFFEYDADELGWWERVRYRSYEMLTGNNAPLSGLTFVWTRNRVDEHSYPNPYTGRLIMRVLRDAEAPTGTWKTERVNIMEEYLKAFGEEPPNSALRMALMSDSDNSGQRTEAALDWIKVRSN